MVFNFVKMNGAGNDFVLIDNREHNVHLTRDQIVRLCDRQRGIGADGLLLLVPCVSHKADWAWEFYNSDGSTADMCGNGARCFARFVQQVTFAPGPLTFETGAGVITATYNGEIVTVNLTAPKALRLADKLALAGGEETVHSINTGVPHAVVFVKDLAKVNIKERGAELRWHAQFAPKGTNVNFVQVLAPGSIRVRTFERGVEGETLACGTGVTASALISSLVHGFSSPVKVKVLGGDELSVSFEVKNQQFENVKLSGPAEFVFEGRITV
jgi:diaminopimelate epimerase